MNGNYVTVREDAGMGPAFAENASARHAGTIGNGDGDGHRPPLQGINVAAWAIGGAAERVGGPEIEDWRSQLGGSAFAQQLRRDARRRKIEAGEQKFVEALMKFTAGAKRSQEPEVAVAARRWEGKIHFHVRVALQRKRKA